MSTPRFECSMDISRPDWRVHIDLTLVSSHWLPFLIRCGLSQIILVITGNYHETVTITEKENIAIRGDIDYPTPIFDGTIELKPIDTYDSDDDGFGDKWRWGHR